MNLEHLAPRRCTPEMQPARLSLNVTLERFRSHIFRSRSLPLPRSSSYACNGIGKTSASGRLTSASGIGKRMMVAPFFVNGLTPALLQSGSPRVSTLTAITTTTSTTLARILTLMTTTTALSSMLSVHVLCVSTYFCVFLF